MANSLRLDDIKKLADLLTAQDSSNESKQSAAFPDWPDPERYPRRARIEDADAIVALTRLDSMFSEARKLVRKLEILESKLSIERAELFERLEEVYPDVLIARRGGSGIRDWRGAWWYVGADFARYRDELEANSPPHGNYL